MRIVVLGSGVVGQATGRGLLAEGHDVIFLDIDRDLVFRLRQEGLHAHIISDDMTFCKADVLMVCVSTPTDQDTQVVNLNYINASMKTVASVLSSQTNWPVVVIRSTVPPTTTEACLIPLIEKHSGKLVGEDFGVCMNPEFLRAKSSEDDFAHPWATVIGEWNQASGDVLEQLYRSFGGKLFRTSLAEAELIKYINNLRNALIISFSNEIWKLGSVLNIDANLALSVATETAESAWNPKYGSTGGYPYGGTCLPKDTRGLRQWAMEFGYDLPLLSAVIEVNEMMDALAQQAKVPSAQIAGHHWQPSPALTNGHLIAETQPRVTLPLSEGAQRVEVSNV